jgi:hypothetical protein
MTRHDRLRHVTVSARAGWRVLPWKKRCTQCGKTKLLTAFYRNKKNRDGHENWCKKCTLAHRAVRRADDPEKAKALRRVGMVTIRARAKKQVFDHYGWVCACPGCNRAKRLCIDHIDGNGREHLASLGIHYGGDFWRWLIREGFPEGYQTLCARCNTAKGNTDRCPFDHSGEPPAA